MPLAYFFFLTTSYRILLSLFIIILLCLSVLVLLTSYVKGTMYTEAETQNILNIAPHLTKLWELFTNQVFFKNLFSDYKVNKEVFQLNQCNSKNEEL